MTEILGGIGSVITAVLGWIVDVFGGVADLFWDPTNNTFTFIGVLLLIAFGISMVWVVIQFIRRIVVRG